MIRIVTPVSRIENLLTIEKSFGLIDLNRFSWDVIIDKSCEEEYLNSGIILEFANVFVSPISKALAGHAHRNWYINKYQDSDDWLMFLDDDTILCKEYELLHYIKNNAEKRNKTAFVINQLNGNETLRLTADKENIRVCHIDMGQFCIKINSIHQKLRFDETNYCADGEFIEAYKKIVGIESFEIVNMERCFSYYNYLRQ